MKRSILLKLIFRFNKIPLKIPASTFIDVDKIILKFLWKHKGTRRAKTVLKKKKGGEV